MVCSGKWSDLFCSICGDIFPSYYGTKSRGMRSIVSAMGLVLLLWIFISDGLNETSSFSEWIMNPVHIGVFTVGGMILASAYIASMFLTIKIYKTRDYREGHMQQLILKEFFTEEDVSFLFLILFYLFLRIPSNQWGLQ